MTESQLFQTGCALCGAKTWRPGNNAGVVVIQDNHRTSSGSAFCGDCYDALGGVGTIDAEITRRKAIAERAVKWEPTIGQQAMHEISGLVDVIQQLDQDLWLVRGGILVRGDWKAQRQYLGPVNAPVPAIDKTRAPDPLPMTLPVGTLWRLARGVVVHTFEVLETSEALRGETWDVATYQRVSPMSGRFSDTTVYARHVDWPSYFAALEKDASCPAGSVDAAHRETAASANQERGAVFESSTHPVVPERPDPYEAHRKDLARGGIHTEPSIAAMTALDPANKKARQARAQLDRPLTPPRFGKLGDRDRYGQKLSLRGWCTDED